MHGVVSLLPAPFYEKVEVIWDELEDEFGLQGIRVTPYPHFSWQIAEDYDFDRLEEILYEIAQECEVFPVNTTGLGLFTGASPVIYIPVVKSAALVRLHTQVWEKLGPVSRGPSPHYSPQAWMPHISLAYEDVNPDNIVQVIRKLAFQSFNWEFNLDNFAVIYEPTGNTGELKSKFQFQSSAGDSV